MRQIKRTTEGNKSKIADRHQKHHHDHQFGLQISDTDTPSSQNVKKTCVLVEKDKLLKTHIIRVHF